jgi:hypothetical protein
VLCSLALCILDFKITFTLAHCHSFTFLSSPLPTPWALFVSVASLACVVILSTYFQTSTIISQILVLPAKSKFLFWKLSAAEENHLTLCTGISAGLYYSVPSGPSVLFIIPFPIPPNKDFRCLAHLNPVLGLNSGLALPLKPCLQSFCF